ncbi:MAG TPA: peptidoglycan-binding protein, partial [Vineibacter sp.]|nr:peptidoglycan-binding protein [Vineibacter sp.]
ERLAALQAALDDADRKVQAFRAENSVVDGPAGAAARAMLEQLQRERDARALAYYAFLARIEQTRISSSQTGTVRIVSPAKPAVRPDGPGVPMIALLGAIVGLLATGAVVAGRQILRGRIGSPQALALASGTTNIGTLPFSRQWAQPGMAVGILEARETGIADTLRGMRMALRNLSQPDDATVVLVTSAERGDGKSTIAASLASVCAVDGLRVLLIEADLYRPRLASMLGWRLGRSLESVLAGENTFEDAVCVDPQTGLHGLFAAGSANSPLAVLEAPAFRDLLARARRDYDIIIMDSPPVLRVADPIALSAYSDAILFAVGWERISRAMLAEALARLPRRQPGVLMTVMTRMPRHLLGEQGYYRGYGRTVTEGGSPPPEAGRPQPVAAVRRVPVDEAPPAEAASPAPAPSPPPPQQGRSAARDTDSTTRHPWAPSVTAMVGAAASVIAGIVMLIIPPAETAEEAQHRATVLAERQADRVSTARPKTPAESARPSEGEELARKAAAEKQAAEIAARRQAEEAERKAQEEAAARAAADKKAAAEAEARRVAQERASAEAAERKAVEEKAAAEQAAAARWREEEAQRAAERKAKADAEAREKAEAEARAAAEETARRQAADEARQQAEAEARRAAEAKPKSDAEARQEAEAAEAALRLSDQDRKRVQAALTSLGHDVRSTSGTFGPRTRAMIAAWQKKQGLPETGYLTAVQVAALQQQVADAQAKPEAAPRKNEEETQSPEIAEAALRLSEQERRRVQVALNSLGHDIGGVTGYFGPRTRGMIAAWQKKQSLPETGYLTAEQLATLRQQAAPALVKYDQAQRRAAGDTQRTE